MRMYERVAIMGGQMTETYKMYTTMHRQPADIRTLLAEGWDGAEEAAVRLADAARIFVVGIGTSFHAAQIGAYLLRIAGVDARADAVARVTRGVAGDEASTFAGIRQGEPFADEGVQERRLSGIGPAGEGHTQGAFEPPSHAGCPLCDGRIMAATFDRETKRANGCVQRGHGILLTRAIPGRRATLVVGGTRQGAAAVRQRVPAVPVPSAGLPRRAAE